MRALLFKKIENLRTDSIRLEINSPFEIIAKEHNNFSRFCFTLFLLCLLVPQRQRQGLFNRPAQLILLLECFPIISSHSVCCVGRFSIACDGRIELQYIFILVYYSAFNIERHNTITIKIKPHGQLWSDVGIKPAWAINGFNKLIFQGWVSYNIQFKMFLKRERAIYSEFKVNSCDLKNIYILPNLSE